MALPRSPESRAATTYFQQNSREDPRLNFLRKRSTIAFASIGAVAAIAAIATAGSLALFYDPPAPIVQTFATGTVSLGNPSVYRCSTGADSSQSIGSQNSGAGAGKVTFNTTGTTSVYPGYSSNGYPSMLGDQKGSLCEFKVEYTGTMDAFMSTDVTVSSDAGSATTISNFVPADCGTSGPCAGLYSPQLAGHEPTDLEVWATYTVPNVIEGESQAKSSGTYALGIGPDQTISQPGASGAVDKTFQSGSSSTAPCQSNGTDCPVKNGYTVLYRIAVYWPLGNSADQNIYQGAQATVTLNVKAVQAYDNALNTCPGIVDPEAGTPATYLYANPDQPTAGWGAGLSSTEGTLSDGQCPAINDTAADWTTPVTSTSIATLYPFSHIASVNPGTGGWDISTNKTS